MTTNPYRTGAVSISTNLSNKCHQVFDPLIKDAEGAKMLGCSKATWWRRVADGTLPRPIKIGGMSRWKRSDVINLIESASVERSS